MEGLPSFQPSGTGKVCRILRDGNREKGCTGRGVVTIGCGAPRAIDMVESRKSSRSLKQSLNRTLDLL